MNDNIEITALCNAAKEMILRKEFHNCEKLISQAMSFYPHSAAPHNLMGILLENEGDHLLAMKHFRAAWALDPTFLPVKYNLNQYADLCSGIRKDAYIEEDCPQEHGNELYKIEFNDNGIGHVIKNKSSK